MSQLIQFTKIEATGNDFIFIDVDDLQGVEFNPKMAVHLCERHLAIGADGLIVMDGLRMKYYNADGSIGAMCGNGLRAATLFSYVSGKIPHNEDVELMADDGAHLVHIQSPEQIKVEIIEQSPTESRLLPQEKLPENLTVLGFYDTGVPHFVLSVERDLDQVDVKKIGKKLRYDSTFSPNGTNVNFLMPIKDDELQLRTYERGVEDETLSCGTGAVASALAYSDREEEIKVRTRGGILTVVRSRDKLFLKGGARIAFIGQVSFDNFSVFN